MYVLMHSVTQYVSTMLLLVWANEAWLDVICFPHITIWCSIWKLVSLLLKKMQNEYICDTVVMVALLGFHSSRHSGLAHQLLSYQDVVAAINWSLL